MTPTTTQSAVLKIHMASDARLTTGPPFGPSANENQRLVNKWCVLRGLMITGLIGHSQLVDVRVSFRDGFSMAHDTLESLEMLTVRWLVMLYRRESGSGAARVLTEPSGGSSVSLMSQ